MENLKQQVIQAPGSGVVKSKALFFHKEDVQFVCIS